MDGSRNALLHGPLFSRRNPLDRSNAASRISAYVYGNILILAALIPVTTTEEHVGILVVIGTALSTFVAHAFAEGVGQAVRENRALTPRQRWEDLRDSVPILSSAVLPSIILACAAVDWLAPRTAQIVAEVAMLVRIGGIVFVIERLKGARPGRSTIFTALLLTAVATTVVVVKVVLTH
ncbi:hypothetical protein [Nocardia africana]|uniref:Integral membrane protein n=1 Tax=Nocardia africana TaxID=134964 RepID=A0A378WXS4_9NOCA|nr:hypothetical protein [Nocardia africana]MCC3312562.1 hypothetical protein [Nocardia africana]SUA46116.1 Uncharacterised protein [Nocardia africana]